MKTYNYLQAWLLSFYSTKFYRDVGQNWRGTGLLYLFLLLSVCLGVLCLAQQRIVKEFINQVGLPIVAQLPDLQIKQGILHVQPSGTHIVVNPLTEQRLIVIDTTHTFTHLKQAQAALLITPNHYIYNDLTQHEVVKALSTVPDVTINQQKIRKVIDFVSSKLFWCIAYGIYVIGYLVGYSMLIILSSGFALICAKQLAIPLNYLTLFRLTTLAYTPIIITSLLGSIVRVSIPYAALIYLFLIVFYIYYAVRANKITEQSSEVVGV